MLHASADHLPESRVVPRAWLYSLCMVGLWTLINIGSLVWSGCLADRSGSAAEQASAGAGALAEPALLPLGVGYVTIWLLGVGAIYWTTRRLVPCLRASNTSSQDLHDQKARLAATLHSIGDAVVSTDTKGCVVDMNPVAEQLTGWSLAEAKDHRFADVFRIVDGRTGNPGLDLVDGVIANGQPVEAKDRRLLLSRNGREYRVAESATPIRNSRGDISGAVIVFRDVTAEHERNLRLRESEERFRGIIESAADLIYAASLDGVITYISSNVVEKIGYEASEVIGQHIAVFTHPDDVPAAERYFAKIRATGKDVSGIQYRGRCRDGSWIWLFTKSAPLKNEAGHTTGYVGVSRDITRRKQEEEQLLRAQDELAQSERRFRDVATVTSDWIWEIDAEGRFTYSSPTVERLLGYKPEEILGRTPFELMPPEEAERVGALAAQTIAAREIFHDLADRVLTKDGRQRVMLTSGVPLFDDQGAFVGYRGVNRDITEQENANFELRQALEQQTAIFDVSLVGVMVLENRIITKVNRRMAEMLGYEPEELEGQGPQQVHLSLENFHEFGEKYYWKLAENEIQGIEYPLRHKDGHAVWCRFNGRAIAPPDLSKGAVWIIDDLTERKRTEEKLANSFERIRELTDSITDVLWSYTVDREGRLIDQSITKPAERILEVEPGTIGDSFEEYFRYIHPDDRPGVEDALQRSMTEPGSEIGEVEYRLVTPTGRTKWVHSRGTATVLPDGSVKLFGRTTDITQRKLADQRQAAESRRIESLLKISQMDDCSIEQITAFAVEESIHLTGSTIGYLATLNDDESVLVMRYWSKSAHFLCEAQDKPLVYPIEETGLWGEAVRQRRPMATNDYAAPNPLKRGLPEGHVPIVRHLNIPVFEGDRIVAVAGVGNKPGDYDDHDIQQIQVLMNGWWQIVERKRRDAELRRTRDKLQQHVLALESTNQALEEFNERAEAATRAKSQFLANMSHEIRTPMTAILGFTDVLLGEEELLLAYPDAADALRTIQRNGQYLLGLINDILDLSKIEAGKIETERQRCSPAEVISEMASLMRVRAEAKNLPFEVEYRGPIPEFIETDPLRLRQILINLVGNAIKFTETGSVRIVTGLSEQGARRPRLQVDVIDTGIGMTEAQKSRLFRPFSQVDSSMTRQHGGTGLGLTISKRLAEMLGGDITVHSKPGRGSTFRVMIDPGPLEGVPMLEKVDEAAGRRSASSPEADSSKQDMPLSGRILLAEDGPDNQRLISFLLRKAGAKVTVAENGKIACEKALQAWQSDQPFDVVVMDMQMPVMDGYAATAQLRKAGYRGPIIALTAHAMDGAEQQCREAGCTDYAKKPIDRSGFIQLVAEHLATAERRSADA